MDLPPKYLKGLIAFYQLKYHVVQAIKNCLSKGITTSEAN
jgi:hypothetical protein